MIGVEAVLVGLVGLVIIVGLAVLPWVFLRRRWRRAGFDWWMIPVGLFAMFWTAFYGGLLVHAVWCMVKGGPCEAL